MLDEAVQHIRRVAPRSVTDDEIRQAIVDTGTDKAKLRAKIDEWWNNHRKLSSINEGKEEKTATPRDKRQSLGPSLNRNDKFKGRGRTQVPESALVSTDSFIEWLEAQKGVERETTPARSLHTGLWDQRDGASRVRRPPQGYIPPEIVRKQQLDAEQPWQVKYKEHLKQQAEALQRVAKLPEATRRKAKEKLQDQILSKKTDLTVHIPTESEEKVNCQVTTSVHEISFKDERIDNVLQVHGENGTFEEKEAVESAAQCRRIVCPLSDSILKSRVLPHTRRDNLGQSWSFGVWNNGREVLSAITLERVEDNMSYEASQATRIKRSIVQEEEEYSQRLAAQCIDLNNVLSNDSHIIFIVAPMQASNRLCAIKVNAIKNEGELVQPDFFVTTRGYHDAPSKELVVTSHESYVSAFFSKEKLDGYRSCSISFSCRYYDIAWTDFQSSSIHFKSLIPKRRLGHDIKDSAVDFADTVLHIGKHGIQLPAHRAVLHASSVEFCKLTSTEEAKREHSVQVRECIDGNLPDYILDAPMVDTQLCLTLKDFQPETIRLLLDYLYSDALDLPVLQNNCELKTMTNMLEAAKYLKFEDLFNQYEQLLCEHVRVDTAAALSKLAESTGSTKLQEAVLNLHLSLVDAPAGILALQRALPERLTPDIEEKLAASVNLDNVSALLSLADRFGSERIRGACLSFSLSHRGALHSDEFRRVAAKTSLGIDMLRRMASSSQSKS